MTDGATTPVTTAEGAVPSEAAVQACCSMLYGHPIAELLVGESFHPGGLRGTRALFDAARLPRGARLLDVGCGLGASARLAQEEFGLKVDAIDVSSDVLERARERPAGDRVSWQRADLAALPFPDGSFDVVLAECVLSIGQRREALAEIRRVLRADGVLLLSDVRRDGRSISGLDDHPLLGTALCLADAWLPGELEALLAAQGFELRRSWDRSDDVLGLVERIEGRLVVAASMAPRWTTVAMGLDGNPGSMNLAQARTLAAAARDAVVAGKLGYIAAVIRPVVTRTA